MPSYLIVGASRGLGYEWLRYLSSDSKNTVIGLVRNTVSTKTKLADENIKTVHVLEADMADHISLNKAAGELSKITDGALDYLIINGAYNNPETAFLAPSAFQGKEDVIRKDLITSLEVNVLGTIYSINAFLPLIRKGLAKKIVVISTGLADMDATLLTGNPCFVAYSSMKAALNMIVVKYSNELRGEDIQLLALSPGIVITREEPPTPQDILEFQEMVKSFQKYAPDWKGPITAPESVKSQKEVIDKITMEDSGAFLSHYGNKKWL